jgi:hypothetical protein
MADLKVALEELKEELDSGRLTAAAPAPVRRRQWMWAAAGALVVAGLVGAWLWRRPAAEPPERLVAATSYPGAESFPSFSPDGRQIAFSWDGERGDNVDIYVKLVGEANALRLTADPADDLSPVWTPDGKRIAFRIPQPLAIFRPGFPLRLARRPAGAACGDVLAGIVAGTTCHVPPPVAALDDPPLAGATTLRCTAPPSADPRSRDGGELTYMIGTRLFAVDVHHSGNSISFSAERELFQVPLAGFHERAPDGRIPNGSGAHSSCEAVNPCRRCPPMAGPDVASGSQVRVMAPQIYPSRSEVVA